MTDLPFSLPEPDATAIERAPRKCRRHDWWTHTNDGRTWTMCRRCPAEQDPAAARRGRNNRARGNAIEREVG